MAWPAVARCWLLAGLLARGGSEPRRVELEVFANGPILVRSLRRSLPLRTTAHPLHRCDHRDPSAPFQASPTVGRPSVSQLRGSGQCRRRRLRPTPEPRAGPAPGESTGGVRAAGLDEGLLSLSFSNSRYYGESL